MIKRTVEVASRTHIKCQHKQMRLERDGTLQGTVPFEDLGVLILTHPGITLTQQALNSAVSAGAVVVLCDQKHLPCAMFLPIADNALHAKVLREQVAWSKTSKKRIWRQIVAAKVGAQADLLEQLNRNHRRLRRIANQLEKSGPVNLEGHAASLYWPALFGKDFRRARFGGGINDLLNYGYAIMRGAVARAICAAGLHPALGIWHRNQYNPFALADDLIEPLRPLVDQTVANIVQRHLELTLNRKTRVPLLELLAEYVDLGGERYPLMVALERYIQSVRKAFQTKVSA